MEVFETEFELTNCGPINLLVVNNHALVRLGVAAIVEGTEIRVVGEAETGAQAIEQAEKLKPDVVLLDVRMPDMDGFQALPGIHKALPQSKVLIFTAYDSPTYIIQCFDLNARSFLLKGAPKDEIVASIARAHLDLPPEFDTPTDQRVSAVYRRWVRDDKDPWPNRNEDRTLTDREKDVLRHVAQGRSNVEIGRKLDIRWACMSARQG